MPQIISKEQIEKAHIAIAPYIHKTDILTNTYLNQLTGASLYFKCENFQKVGAFKMRGACNAIQQIPKEQLKHGVLTHSSGNHAQALALAAKIFHTKAFIVMPENAPKIKVAAVRGYGAEIIFCESTPEARERTAKEIETKTGAVFIHPFNNLDIIAGQASVAKEIIEEIPDLDAIVCPVGGGGLLSGSILAASYFSPETSIYAAEPFAVDDAYRSVLSGKIEENKSTNTIADGLRTPLGNLTFEIIKPGVKEILRVEETEIKSAMRLIWERLKIIIEPSSAVPLAAILKYPKYFTGKRVAIILSGGNVDVSAFFEKI